MNDNMQRFIIAIALILMLGYMIFMDKISAEYFVGLVTGVIGFYFTASAKTTKDKERGADDNNKKVGD